MKNVLLKIEYKGTNYSGWQIQPGTPTVQAVLQNTISRICQHQVVVKACSRTDAGVHAKGQLATVMVPEHVSLAKLFRSSNSLLPSDIGIIDMIKVDDGFSVRQAACGKRYVYQIINSPIDRIFFSEMHLWVKSQLDLDATFSAMSCLKGTHDFSAFKGKGCQQPSPVKTINHVDIQCEAEDGFKRILLIFEGSGFLKNMVRIMAGTLLNIAQGRLNKSIISELLISKNRDKAGLTVPAKGLVLDRIFLQPDPFVLQNPD